MEEKKPVESTESEPLVEETPVVREIKVKIGSKTQDVVVTSGRMPLRNEKGEIEAQMFYMAYRLKSGTAKRPLMFSFNGGPGSPSLWLHLGALGPQRVKMLDTGEMPTPPFELVENALTWLEFTDLVFIDPIGTGFSRAKTPEIAEKFWSLKGDIESVAEFIRLYLTRNERWNSPLYLVGESYGTTRAAGLAGYLTPRGVAFNGLALVSSILNFQTARFVKGNDLPYILFLPTFTATAWYHNCLEPSLQKDLKSTVKRAEQFAIGDYAAALAQGDRLSAKERSSIIRKLARFTGLSPYYIDLREMRLNIHMFVKELLRDERRTVGRLDSRFKGIDLNAAGERNEHDPSMTALMPPYVSLFCHYVRSVLGYESDLEYAVFGGIKKPWDFGNAAEGHPDTSEALRMAMSMNPHMKVFIASGLYDLATPHFATEYTLAHMDLDPSLRSNVETREYEAGHMMYIHEPSLKALFKDVQGFVRTSQGS
ncbi:MAG TPA: hypothetical protein PLO61_10850 [Fimbriimonadaceae bacterium]|nr:hypothetical protein [Fimbriimonadaceae bacterium]HRJ34137.1 hypothetical protein [Fimbriimonadaceae bacterium]